VGLAGIPYVGVFLGQALADDGAVAENAGWRSLDGDAPATLQDAFRELARIERALVEAGDRRMLARFGDPERGAEVASLFGYSVLATEEARTVDRLTYLPQAQMLIREYLEMTRAPHAWDLQRQSHGGELNTQRPATIVETTSASRSSQGSRSSTTRSAA